MVPDMAPEMTPSEQYEHDILTQCSYAESITDEYSTDDETITFSDLENSICEYCGKREIEHDFYNS